MTSNVNMFSKNIEQWHWEQYKLVVINTKNKIIINCSLRTVNCNNLKEVDKPWKYTCKNARYATK